MNNLSYHGQDLSIVWNNDGTYNAPKGYTLYLAGKPVFTSDKLAHLIYDPATGTVEVMDDSGAQVTGAITATLPAANQVTYGADDRVTEIFATSGQNIDSASDSQIDVARGADVEATYEADGYPATNAVDRQERHGVVLGHQGIRERRGLDHRDLQGRRANHRRRAPVLLPDLVLPDDHRLQGAVGLHAGIPGRVR